MKKTNKKLSRKHKYMLMVLTFGIVFSIVIFRVESHNIRIYDGNILQRNEYGMGDYDLNLTVRYQDNDKDIPLHVAEREFTDEELNNMSSDAYEVIKASMLKGNEDLNKVTKDLNFPLKIPEYPFDLRWAVSDEDVIDQTGRIVCEDGCMDTHSLIVSVILMYRDYRQTLNYEITVIPKQYSLMQMNYFGIRKKIDEAIEDSAYINTVCLPEEYQGKSITYSSKIPRGSVMMMVVSFILSVVIGICVEYDEKKRLQKVRDELEKSYGVFVEKMKLYIISGLTVKSAFFEIRKSLENAGDSGFKELLKRVNIVCNKYSNGCMEESIINEFGADCGTSYRKLAFLLSINLKRGNDKLIDLMESEVTKTNEKRKETARKKGDEAGVKLLFPMMGMLVIIMAIIILPAYLNF